MLGVPTFTVYGTVLTVTVPVNRERPEITGHLNHTNFKLAHLEGGITMHQEGHHDASRETGKSRCWITASMTSSSGFAETTLRGALPSQSCVLRHTGGD